MGDDPVGVAHPWCGPGGKLEKSYFLSLYGTIPLGRQGKAVEQGNGTLTFESGLVVDMGKLNEWAAKDCSENFGRDLKKLQEDDEHS